jgi:putative peptide zinc metalloprotease protein
VLQAKSYSVVVTQASGVVTEILAANGSAVQPGQPLFRMVNGELELRLASARAQLAETDAMQRKALRFATADLAPLQTRAEATQKLIRRLEDEQTALLVRAPHAGRWVAPNAAETKGSWLERGAPLGQLVDGSEFYFSAIVSQKEAARLFSGEIRGSEIKLKGQAGVTLPVGDRRVIPAERKSLPSAALGWAGGGEIAVDNSDRTGIQATEPFFEVRATIPTASGTELLHGRGGQIRFEGKPEPLLEQWVRRLRQLLQSRYGV